MADFATKQADPGTPAAQDAPNTQQAQVEKVLMSFGESKFQEFARYRFAEEREWGHLVRTGPLLPAPPMASLE